MRAIGRALAMMLAMMAMTGPARAAEPEASYEATFDAAWRTVGEAFYDPGFHGADWTALRDRYRPRLAKVRDEAALQRLIGAMLAELKSSHLHISRASPERGSAGLGARIEPVGGVRTVLEVAPLSDARRQGLRPGDQLPRGMAGVAGPLGSIAEVEVRRCDGSAARLSIRRERAFWPPARPGFAWSRIVARPGLALGYLKIDRFDDGAAGLADQAMAELGDTQGLVIDLRDNSGGNMSALRLASYFGAVGEAPAVALFSRAYLEGLGRAPTLEDIRRGPKVVGAYTDEAVGRAVQENGGAAVFHLEDVGQRRYRGPVVVLIGPETASAAEGFAWVMKQSPNVRFVGEASAGALLSGERFELPGGWVLTVPVFGVWRADGENLGDRAVQPDLPAPLTREDLCAGRDPGVARALELLAPPRP